MKDKLIRDIGILRYEHCLRVADIGMKLGEIYEVNKEKIRIAALFHDCGKLIDESCLLKRACQFDIILDVYMEYNKELIHGPLGAKMAKYEYNIIDEDILNSIYYHTIGRKNMTIIEKIIYIADYIEPNRQIPGIEEVRKLAFKELDEALLLAIERTIIYLMENHIVIHPNTIETRNYLLMEKIKN